MKSFKEFREQYQNLPLLTEEEFQIFLQILQESENPEDYYEQTKKQMGPKMGPLLGKGSSRAAHAGVTIPIKLRQYSKDGGSYTVVDHHVPVVYKFAIKHYSSYDSVREPHQKMLGQLQNLNEVHPVFDPLRTYHKHEDGTYSANPHGIIPTVFHAHPEGLYLISERIRPIKTADFHKIHGIHMDDMGDYLNALRNHAIRGLGSTTTGMDIQQHQEYGKHNITEDHPLVKSWRSAVTEAGLHGGDFNEDNTGMSINHPHGERVLMADSGFLTPPGHVEGLHNTVKEYAKRSDKKYQADRKKIRMGIPLTNYSRE
jgi:hypothetical protein